MKMYICVMIWALPALECGVGLFMIMICSSLVLSRNVYGLKCGDCVRGTVLPIIWYETVMLRSADNIY